jgi:hypothetical protein
LYSEDPVERVYALEELVAAESASDEDLDRVVDLLLDYNKYGFVIVERGGRVSGVVQGRAYEGQEVKYLKEVYTAELENAFDERVLCDLAYQTLLAHQPAATDVAVRRLPKEKAGKMRIRILDLLADCCRQVDVYSSPVAVRELKRMVENRKEDKNIRKKALTTLLLLSDPEISEWVLTTYPRAMDHLNFSPIRNDFHTALGGFVMRRPIEMLQAFEDPEGPTANRTFQVLRSGLGRGDLSDEHARTVLEDIVERQHRWTVEMLLEVLKRSPSEELKNLAGDLLAAQKNPEKVQMLVKQHVRSQRAGDTFACNAIQSALKNAGTPEALDYLQSLDAP